MPFITLAPIFAEAGTIYVNADNFEGGGSLIAPGNVSITITNNSPAYLSVGQITIPQSFGGTVFFDGSTVTTNAGIGGSQSEPDRAVVHHPGRQHSSPAHDHDHQHLQREPTPPTRVSRATISSARIST